MNSFAHLNSSKRYWRRSAVAVVALGAVAMAAVPASSQAQAAKARGPRIPAALVIYRGDSLQGSGLSLGNWGSGVVDADTSKVLSGTNSIRLVTHGLYQGGSLNFAKPVNFGPFLAGKYNYLTVTVNVPTGEAGAAAGGPSGYSGFGGKGGYGQGAGTPMLGGPGGSSGPGSYGGYGKSGGQVQAQKNRKLENLRLVMVTTGGKSLEVMLPIANATEENQWKTLAIPVSAIPGLGTEDSQIQSMRLFGDAPTTLNIGSIGIVEDSAPIMLDSINDKTVQRLSRYQYVATATAGVTPLVYSWDWDASDGIQDETQGRNVTHTFRKASADDAGKTTDFVVTVTVSDLYNIKAPVKTTFKVHVTP